MFTSYFAKLSKLSNPLSISRKSPNWYTGPVFELLAPKWSFLNDYKDGKIDNLGYIEQYHKLVLAPLDPKTTYQHLIDVYGDDVTLLCYEKPSDFCHRHIVALWFEKELNIQVPERKF